MSSQGLLLDTSVLIWWLSEPERLSPQTAALIADPGYAISCSVVNLWEIQIKSRLGKLDLVMPLAEIHAAQELFSSRRHIGKIVLTL